MRRRNDVCWCGADPLPNRATCSPAHASEASGKRRRKARFCRCGAPALPKRATCSDACAARYHGLGVRQDPSHTKPPKPPKPYRLCRCGVVALPGRRTCSDACARQAVSAVHVRLRSPERAAKRTAAKRLAYRKPDKDEVIRALTRAQGAVCAVCRQPGEVRGQVPALVLDHCHVTGKPRAMLCLRCNISVGQTRESPEIVASLLRYVEQCGRLRRGEL